MEQAIEYKGVTGVIYYQENPDGTVSYEVDMENKDMIKDDIDAFLNRRRGMFVFVETEKEGLDADVEKKKIMPTASLYAFESSLCEMGAEIGVMVV